MFDPKVSRRQVLVRDPAGHQLRPRLYSPLPEAVVTVPVRITLSSVGPGVAPVAASFSVALDPQVVSDVRIVSARLNNKAYDAGVRLLSDTRTVSLFETRWTTRAKLKSGDRLDLGLEVRTRKPTGDLPTVKHPTVGLIDMGNHITQRQTGLTTMSRRDAQWT
ncbi:hypothetical protein OG824_18810 [Streptomyces prunicolor]|uniref:hypothetical protein n=1 Tax=Streptomyces prunicolor TaxID=67348 RepID=UPI002259AA62|nr:hypothetical protein [Streptomyces prunicolor]MCX5237254.1 hypothetical protein [Streptomyces prunicolor]